MDKCNTSIQSTASSYIKYLRQCNKCAVLFTTDYQTDKQCADCAIKKSLCDKLCCCSCDASSPKFDKQLPSGASQSIDAKKI